MDNNEAWSAKELSDIKIRLEEKKQLTISTLEQLSQGTQTVDLDAPIGRLSRMDALQGQSMAVAQTQRLKGQALKIDAALKRISEGDYGLCLKCEEPIPKQRLLAQPEATLCTECLD